MYIHINKINGKRYIGLTKQTPEARWGIDGKNYKSSCPRFWNAIQKYGWDNFEHIVVKNGLSKNDACALEIQLIEQFMTQSEELGYNILSGGSAPSIPAEVRARMSEGMIGNKNGLGHACSEEKKRKISEAQKGRRLTEEHKEKLSAAKKGIPRGPMNDEIKKKISKSHAKLQVFCEETGVIYESVQACSRQLGLYATNVCKCCRGKIKTTGGYHLTYYNSTINA